jgi:DNA polymerase-1
MIRVAEAAARGEWKGRMLVQVHDELLFEIPNEHLEKSQAVIKSIMENAIPLSIPVIVDLKSGVNWADMTPVREKVTR